MPFKKNLFRGITGILLAGALYVGINRYHNPQATCYKPDNAKQVQTTSYEQTIDNFVELDFNKLETVADALLENSAIVPRLLTDIFVQDIMSNPTSLESAIKRSEDYMPYIKHIFQKKKVPKEYAFLAIPESFFLNRRSHAGAKGVYQIMPRTGWHFGMVTKQGFDERDNVFLSAETAAKILRFYYESFGSWELALARYNSGMPERYKREENNISYEGYLRFLGRALYKELEKNPIGNGIRHKIHGGETLASILRRFSTYSTENLKTLMTANNISNPRNIQIGMEIYIPQTLVSKKAKISSRKVSFIKENLEYPPKFFAVLEILKNNYPAYFNIESEQPLFSINHTMYTKSLIVKKGHNLYSLAKRYNVPFGSLLEINGFDYQRTLSLGESIDIPHSNTTLSNMAKRLQMPLKKAKELNPHIKSPYAKLPACTRVLAPQKFK